jgi:hypothetical protein
VLVPVGGFLVVYAASLWFLGTRARVSRPRRLGGGRGQPALGGRQRRRRGRRLVVADRPTGIAVVLAQAAAVVTFAELQLTGLRRSRTVA